MEMIGVFRSCDTMLTKLLSSWFMVLHSFSANSRSAISFFRSVLDLDYFINFTNFGNLENALGSKVQYVDVKSNSMANIGFQGIQVKGPRGAVTVIPDPKCPAQVAYGINMKAWKCYSLKKMFRILNLDGNRFLRLSESDANEMRIGGYYQFGCSSPGSNIRLSLDT